MRDTRIISGLLAVAAGVAVAGQALAADAEADFYKGKQITFIVPSEASGAYNGYARLLARYWKNHIPGNPNFVVQNMPGGGGMTAANWLANKGSKDGLTLGIFFASAPTQPMVSPDIAMFDGNAFGWIGSITADPFVGYVWHTSPVQSLEQAKTQELIIGGPQGLGSAGVDYAVLAKAMTPLKIKLITGYPSSNDVKLAMERGEVHGAWANGYASLKSSAPDWIPEKKITIIVQHGLRKHAELPNVPLLIDQVSNPLDKQALEFMLARQEFARPFAVPPGVPAARLAVLRKAFDETVKDPELLAEAKKENLPVDGPMNGQDVQAMVKKVTATPKAAVDRIQDIFDKFKVSNK
jgi:tripartite-type tricarboxylate transporter receptor subunit TctC